MRSPTFAAIASAAWLLFVPQRLLAQTAHEYFEELKTANGINPLATLVCFPEQENASFALAALSSQFEDTLKAKGLAVPDSFKELSKPGAEKYLWWEGFHKGIPASPWLLDHVDDPPHWVFKFDKLGERKHKGEVDIVINWSTLRYKLEAHVGKTTETVYGRCVPLP
jgi:hypothetical protein